MKETRPFLIHEDDCATESWDDPEHGNARWKTLISADRSPTESLTVGTAEVQPGDGKPYRVHRHPHPEVYYVLAGEGLVWVDGQEFPVRSGSTLFIPGSAEHALHNSGSVPLRLLYVFPAEAFHEVEYEFP